MRGTIAEGKPAPDQPGVGRERARPDRTWELAIGLGIALVALVLYVSSNPFRFNYYEHFTWQAAAWLEGEAGIRYPVFENGDEPYNDFFLDVLPLVDDAGNPTGRALIPFPPLPAVVLLPFVALWGLRTDAQLLASIFGALDVWLVWWMLGGLPARWAARAAATSFFAFGTVFWYTAMLGTTWYFAHVVAVGLAAIAIGLALRGDRVAVDAAVADAEGLAPPGHDPGWGPLVLAVPRRLADVRALLDGRQFVAGLALGLAATARLPLLFGLPFLMLVGGSNPLRRAVSAALGLALPIAGLVAYNLVTTGHLFHPAYEYLYQVEAYGYPDLGYHPDWAIEDLRYIPQNLALLVGGLPSILPACAPGAVRGLFDAACPYVIPRDIGMSLLLTSPAYLLALPALRGLARARVVTGAGIAIAGIIVINLMHFSQGWVQFGYRFSNDFAPFALLLVTLGIARLGGVGWRTRALILVSVLVNLWGVIWGLILWA